MRSSRTGAVTSAPIGDHSSALSKWGFKIKLHLVLTVAATSFVTFEAVC